MLRSFAYALTRRRTDHRQESTREPLEGEGARNLSQQAFAAPWQ
jgi:hypothetical protein